MEQISFILNSGNGTFCPFLSVYSNVISNLLKDCDANDPISVPFPDLILLTKVLEEYSTLEQVRPLTTAKKIKLLEHYTINSLCDLLCQADFFDISILIDPLVFLLVFRNKEGWLQSHEYQEIYDKLIHKFNYYNLFLQKYYHKPYSYYDEQTHDITYASGSALNILKEIRYGSFDHCLPHTLLDHMIDHQRFSYDDDVIDLREYRLTSLEGFDRMNIVKDNVAIDLSYNQLMNFLDSDGNNCFRGANAKKIKTLIFDHNPITYFNPDQIDRLPNLQNFVYHVRGGHNMEKTVNNYRVERGIDWWYDDGKKNPEDIDSWGCVGPPGECSGSIRDIPSRGYQFLD